MTYAYTYIMSCTLVIASVRHKNMLGGIDFRNMLIKTGHHSATLLKADTFELLWLLCNMTVVNGSGTACIRSRSRG